VDWPLICPNPFDLRLFLRVSNSNCVISPKDEIVSLPLSVPFQDGVSCAIVVVPFVDCDTVEDCSLHLPSTALVASVVDLECVVVVLDAHVSRSDAYLSEVPQANDEFGGHDTVITNVVLPIPTSLVGQVSLSVSMSIDYSAAYSIDDEVLATFADIVDVVPPGSNESSDDEPFL